MSESTLAATCPAGGNFCSLEHFRSQTSRHKACVSATWSHMHSNLWEASCCTASFWCGVWCGVWCWVHRVIWWQGLPEGSEEVVTRKVWEESWWARRRACSPMGTALMCSFWISSMLPMVRPDSLAMARLSGKLALLKLVIKFTYNPAFAVCWLHLSSIYVYTPPMCKTEQAPKHNK